MPAEGGEATRLTFHSSNDYPGDFSPDGEHVLFGSSRTDDWRNSQYPTGRFSELYTVPVGGGTPDMVLTTPAIATRYDASGDRILYEERAGYENMFRKHHTSSVTRDLWLYDVDTGEHRKVADYEGEDLNPVWDGDDGCSSCPGAAGPMNVYRSGLDSDDDAQALTSFEDHPVRYSRARTTAPWPSPGTATST